MKTLLFFTLLIASSSFAQTNIIAAKSHASSSVVDQNDQDNFGNPEVVLPLQYLHSVEYIEPDCIVEKSKIITEEEFIYDTICDHPFLRQGSVDIERLKAMYKEGTEFINFEALNKDEGNFIRRMREKRHSSKSSALWILIIAGGSFLAYLFIPRPKMKTP